MTKQVLKGLTMFMAILTFAMVTAVASANGQTVNARAKVPFEFVVGDKTLPAGEYRLSNATTDAIRIANTDSQAAGLRLSQSIEGKVDCARLIFHKYGERYFLAQVWSDGTSGRELTTSREERAIQKAQSSIALHKPSTPAFETVALAVNVK